MGWLHSLDTSRDPAAWRKAQVSLQMLQYSQGVKLHHPCFLASCSRLHIYEPWTSRFMSFPHGPLPFWQWSETSRPRQILPTLELYGIVTYCHIQIARHCKTLSVWIRHAELALSFSKNDTKKYCYAAMHTLTTSKKSRNQTSLQCPKVSSVLQLLGGSQLTRRNCHIGGLYSWLATSALESYNVKASPWNLRKQTASLSSVSRMTLKRIFTVCKLFTLCAEKKEKNASLLQQVISLQ